MSHSRDHIIIHHLAQPVQIGETPPVGEKKTFPLWTYVTALLATGFLIGLAF